MANIKKMLSCLKEKARNKRAKRKTKLTGQKKRKRKLFATCLLIMKI